MKKTVLIFAIAAALFQTLRAQQYILTDDDVIVQNGIIQSCSYNFFIKDLIIADTLDGQAVTGIATSVFRNKSITAVKLPVTLEWVGNHAFYENFEMYQIDLSACTNLISIGYYAFTWSQVDSLDLTNCTSLRSIHRYAFRNYHMDGFYLPMSGGYEWKDSENNSYNGGDFVEEWGRFYYVDFPYTLTDDDLTVENGFITEFRNNNPYKNIAIPETIDGQTIIGIIDKTDTTSGVFQSQSLFEVHFPETIQSIGWGAFSGNNIIDLELSQCTQLSYIGQDAFSENEIISLDINGCKQITNFHNGVFNGNRISNLNLSGFSVLETIDNNAFNGSSIASLNLTDCEALTYIGVNAFKSNNIVNLDLSDCASLTQIDASAFYDNDIDTLNLCGSPLLTHINNAAFAYNGISYINFGESSPIVSIGDQAFKYSAFGMLDLSQCMNLTIIGSNAFANANINSINFTGCTTLTTINKQAFYDNNLTNLDLMPCTGLMTIGEHAFSENDLSAFELPLIEGFEEEGWRDLYNIIHYAGDTVSNFASFYCVNNAYVLTADDLEVENGIIVGCSYDFARNYIRIPESINGEAITGIKDASVGIFQDKGIYILELSKNLEYIGTRAFAYNILRDVDFGTTPNLIEIGREAFLENFIDTLDLSGCSNLTRIGSSSFKDNNNMKALILEGCSSLKSIGDEAFWDNSIHSLDFSDCSSLTIIEYYAFMINNISSIDFSGCTSLVTIDTDAFFSNNISSVDLSNCTNLKTIGYGSFYGNYISSLNLSGCHALTLIDYEAFHSNSLSSVDLSNCPSLAILGYGAFSSNNMSSFTLPTPNYPGFEYWEDWFGETYNAGEIVTVNMEYRAKEVYSPLTFIISSSNGPVDSAMISFYSREYFCDENGIKSFPKILQGTYSYTVSAEGYEDATGVLELGVDSLTVYVNMSGNSVSEIENENIRLYPNPGVDELFVETPPLAEGARVEIINNNGKVVLQQQINSGFLKLSLPLLNAGVYFYRVYKDGEVLKSGKWIKR